MKVPHEFELLTLSSLEKVMLTSSRPGNRYENASILKNERFHYQIAIKACFESKVIVEAKVDSPICGCISLFEVGHIPCELTKLALNDPRDTNFISEQPGLFPDILEPIKPSGISLTSRQWKTVWVTVESSSHNPLIPGKYPIDISFIFQEKTIAKSHFEITILDSELIPQKLIYTNWFHLDSLMTYYHVDAFSSVHWELIENYLNMAVSRGMNMILTPCFTPPLDTAVGGERPTVQLVGVCLSNGVYSFNFEKLERFILLSKKCGIRYFEIAHLFTQWGAKFAPKVMATVDGEYRRIFGWDTASTGECYTNFLKQFLPAIVSFLKEIGVYNSTYFHISDEPSLEHLESYKAASELVSNLVEGIQTFDALSDYEFYKKGLVHTPIPTTHSVDEFYENGVTPLWCYYCAFSSDFLTMRYIAAPSARNRIFGYQLYKYNIVGFLHWGYNFYYSQYSIYPIDPYRNTDSGGWCPPGDNYLVYPGSEGPISSIHFEVFADALQDLRALQTLEAKIGRSEVLLIIDEGLEKPLSMYDYPKDDEWILNIRQRVNSLIIER